MARGGDQSDKSNIGEKRSPPNPSRPTPQRGPFPVPAGSNRSPPPTLRMGVHGVSAFTPFIKPSRPTPQRGPVPVPGGNRSPPTTLPLQIGVPGVSAFVPYVRTSPPPTHPQLDEGMEVVNANAGGPGRNNEGEVVIERGVVQCSICQKEFQSGRSLFGHMRSHPERGWKGTRPPPTFNASEEFADLGLHFQPPPPLPVPDQPAPPDPEAPDASGDTARGFQCSICKKEFQSGRALIGHMRSHPPPAFNASEEFADLGLLFQPAAPPDQPEAPDHASGDTAGGGDRHW